MTALLTPHQADLPRTSAGRVLLFIGMLAAITGCGEPDTAVAPPPVIPKQLGVYGLISRDGVPMRIALPDSAGSQRELASAQLTLRDPRLSDETFSIIILTSPSGVQTLQRRTDGVLSTMLSPTTLRIDGVSFLAGTATVESDSIMTVQSDSTAWLGQHLWRLRRVR